MIARVVGWSARHKGIVAVLVLAAASGGELARRALVRDVIPELSDPQIVIIAEWMGHPATEVANRVTTVLSQALEGTPGSTEIRGSSMAGMAFLDVVLDSSSDLGRRRAEIQERVGRARARLPAGARVKVGPEASSTGWVLQYAIIDPTRRYDPVTLRRFQDEILRPALTAIPGVAEIASVGGAIEEVVVEIDPARLLSRGLAFSDLVPPLRAAVSGGTIPSADELGRLAVASPPSLRGEVRLRDLARVRTGAAMPAGLADYDGTLAPVGGIVIARRGADISAIAQRVNDVLEIERSRLPPGAQLVTVYDRSELAARVEQTLFRALREEIGAVLVVVLVFLLHGRSALIPLLTLPLVLLLTFAGMWLLRIPATVMSLGGIGIALGLAVDAEIVALEACHRALESNPSSSRERRAQLVAASGSLASAILTSLTIAALAFLPVLAFSGENGRLLRPLALTKTLVIGAAALVALTAAPALRDLLLRGRVIGELRNPLTSGLVRLYRPFVHFALRHPAVTLATAALIVASAIPVAANLGREFLPRVDEGDLLYMPTTLAGVPAETAMMELRQQDRALRGFDEVATVFGKAGRADTATDPAPFSMVETTIRLRPRAEWPLHPRKRWYSSWAPPTLKPALAWLWPEQSPATVEELTRSLDEAVRRPGWTGAWTAPIRARMDMMSTGVRTPVGIRVVAPDPARLDALGSGVRDVVLAVPGTASAVYESLGGQTWLRFDADRQALADHDVSPELVAATADLVLSGGEIADLERDGRRRKLRLASDVVAGRPAERIREITVRSAPVEGSHPVPLGLLGRPAFVDEPATVHTARGGLASYVHVSISNGTPVSEYVEKARSVLAAAIRSGALRLDPGERIEWTGQYELLRAGEQRLKIIVPIVVVSMLLLLLLQFRNLAAALIVLVSVPFALVGSVWTLFLLGYPLSAPVWVGLLSVLGLAMQTAVVMVVYIDDAFFRRVREGRLQSRDDIVAAHAEGTIRRLRPKLMTILTMAAGLLPLVWADGAGAEITRRIAAPMLGGLVSSAFLTLEVLPVLYTLWRHRQLRVAQQAGIPIEILVGTEPGWARR